MKDNKETTEEAHREQIRVSREFFDTYNHSAEYGTTFTCSKEIAWHMSDNTWIDTERHHSNPDEDYPISPDEKKVAKEEKEPCETKKKLIGVRNVADGMTASNEMDNKRIMGDQDAVSQNRVQIRWDMCNERNPEHGEMVFVGDTCYCYSTMHPVSGPWVTVEFWDSFVSVDISPKQKKDILMGDSNAEEVIKEVTGKPAWFAGEKPTGEGRISQYLSDKSSRPEIPTVEMGHLHIERRIIELGTAISLCASQKIKINDWWVREYNDLLEELKTKKFPC